MYNTQKNETMFKFVFVRTPKPRQFNHVPIYWDPEKEARQERDERIQRDLGTNNPDEPFKSRIKRGSFRKKAWNAPTETSDMKAERRRSNIRLLCIAIVLIAIAYWMFITI